MLTNLKNKTIDRLRDLAPGEDGEIIFGVTPEGWIIYLLDTGEVRMKDPKTGEFTNLI